ncbi:MAG: hypothetical protein ABI761_06470 [Saprospiraceae bacterium]
MKKLIIGILILTNYSTFCQKPIKGNIKDTAAFELELAKRMMEAMAEDYKPSDKAVPERIYKNPIPSSLTESRIKELNALVANSYYFRSTSFAKDELMVEADNFFYSSPDMVKSTVTWTKALDKTGKNLLKPEETQNQGISFNLNFNGNQAIKLQGENAMDIVKAEGTIKITAPLNILKIRLTKDQINKEQMLDTFKVRLIRIDNDLASVWINADYQKIYLYAFNDRDVAIDVNQNSSMILNDEVKKVKELKLPKELGEGSFLYIKANGKIDHVDLLYVAKTMEQTLKIVATPIPEFEPGKTKYEKERYENFFPRNFTNLTIPDTLLFSSKENIKIIREYSEWDKETKWRTSYQLPNQYVQTAYALPEFKDVTLYLKGKVVKKYPSQGFYDPLSGIMSFIAQNDEYKPIEYDEARGTIGVRYPIGMKTITIKKGEKKNGVEKIEGNKLSLNDNTLGDVHDLLNASELNVVRAYGKGSWPLKQLSYSSSEYINDVSLQHRYYWGNITSVQMDQPTGWINMTFPFAVKRSEEKKSTKSEKAVPSKKKN